MTLHGRSRQQRYAKLADWGYIKECADVLRNTCSDAGIPAPPIFGNGDCFSAQSYYEEMENSGVDGVMVARGALIKPWIFTEIKERREWDISATERLEGFRKVRVEAAGATCVAAQCCEAFADIRCTKPHSTPNTVSAIGVPILEESIPPVVSSVNPCLSNIVTSPLVFSNVCLLK